MRVHAYLESATLPDVLQAWPSKEGGHTSPKQERKGDTPRPSPHPVKKEGGHASAQPQACQGMSRDLRACPATFEYQGMSPIFTRPSTPCLKILAELASCAFWIGNMRVCTAFLLILSSFILHHSSLSHAAFQDPYWSARVASLGGAFVALSDDPTGVFYNPAGVYQVEGRQGSFSYAKLFAGLDEVNLSLNTFGYVQPVGSLGMIGFGWGNFNSSDLYREDTVLLSFARNFKDVVPHLMADVSLGVSVRYLTRRFVLDERTADDPVFRDGRRKSNASVDLHLYSHPSPEVLPGLSVGLSLRSLNEPDIGFLEEEKLPREFTGGVAYRWRGLTLPLDIVFRDGETDPRVGLEFSLLKDRMMLRVGSDVNQIGTGFGYRHSLSERFYIIFDYGFIWPLEIEETVGTHRATLGLKF